MTFPRYIGSESVETFAQNLVKDNGDTVLPSFNYSSTVADTPINSFSHWSGARWDWWRTCGIAGTYWTVQACKL